MDYPAESGVYKYNDGAAGVFTNVEKSKFFRLYPNPTDNEIIFEINKTFTDGKFTILTPNLKPILNINLTNNTSRIDLSQLPEGIYIGKLIIDGTSETQKVIIF